MIPNERTVTIKLKRREVTRLMVACTILGCSDETESEEAFKRWRDLHDKLSLQLLESDMKHDGKLYNNEYKED